MTTGSACIANEPVHPSSPFLLGFSATPGSRLKPHQAIARWICGEARKAVSATGEPTVDREEIAAALGFRLVRVKRSLALLSLSGVLECRAGKVVVRDWLRLCGIARIEPAELGIRPVEQIEAEALLVLPRETEDPVLEPVKTAAGEPACFV